MTMQSMNRFFPLASRAGLLAMAFFALALCVSLPLRVQAAAGGSRPNFLFIYSDDQRYDALGCVQREQGERARFPWFQSPHLDRIAAEGVRFRNAFVVNSLCAPSRATFLTGCYGHVNGIVNNHTPFPENNVTHATALRAAGYTTGYIGKWHMGNQSGQRPGFTYSASFVGQGRYWDCPIEVNGVSTPSQGWVDDVSTDYAVEFMKKNKGTPWSLVVGYKATHGPWDPPERARNRFEGCEARPVPNLDSPAIYKNAVTVPGSKKARKKAVAPSGPRTVNLNYFRCLSAMDDNVGRLLQTLDELGLADHTCVVFAGDNGYYLGEHGLGDKRSAYEESLRIPLLLRFPKLAPKGRLADEMVLNTDLAPTFVDLAGIAVPKQMQGRSWKPLLEGHVGDWRRAYFYCYFQERNFAIPTVTAVRTEFTKLIKYPGPDEWTELFDLKTDPYELKNLAHEPAHQALLAQMQSEYDRQAKAVDFKIPDFADKPEPPAKRGRVFVLDYNFAKDAGDRVVDASGNRNDGLAKGAPLAVGRPGHRARRFDGQGFIEVPKSSSLDPSRGPWTVEIVLQAGQPNGIILARGGKSQGYALHLQDGKPAFSVCVQDKPVTVIGRKPIVGEWAHVAGVISGDQRAVLYVNGAVAAERPLPSFLPSDPNDTMQIGADNSSTVTQQASPAKFVGLIESVRLFSGERSADDLKKAADQ